MSDSFCGTHLSQVTVCLAMYVVALLGTIVSIGYRIFCFSHLAYLKGMSSYSQEKEWAVIRIVSCNI